PWGAGVAAGEGGLAVSPDGSVLIWTARRGLRAGLVHFVATDGLRDRRGRPVRPHLRRFVPCDIALNDLLSMRKEPCPPPARRHPPVPASARLPSSPPSAFPPLVPAL